MQELSNKVANGGISDLGKLLYSDWNEVAAELENIIEGSGLVLSGASLTQLLQAVVKISRGYSVWGLDTGSSTAYVVATAIATTPTLYVGMTIRFRPANTNTTVSPTLNFQSSGAKNIINEAGGQVGVGDLSVNRDSELRYDGTSWRLLNSTLDLTSSSLYPHGYINGYYLVNDGTNPDTTLQISAGRASAFDAALNLILSSSFTKRIDTTWTLGTGGGGRPTAVSLSPNTYYRVFVIGGISAATDAGFDTSTIATNLLSTASSVSGNTYDKYRQIGWILTDGSSNIVRFYMDPADFSVVNWQTPALDVSGSGPVTTRLIGTLTSPPDTDAIIAAWVGVRLTGSVREYVMDIRPSAMTDLAPSASNYVLKVDNLPNDGDSSDSIHMMVSVNASRQMAYRFAELSALSTTPLDYSIVTRGYRYIR